MSRFAAALSLCLAFTAATPRLRAAVSVSLTEIQRLSNEGMEGLCGVCASPDGKHVYAVGLQSNCISTFSVNKETGKLTAENNADVKEAGFTLGVKISPDGKYVAACAWQSGSITLFERDASDGSLTEVSKITKEETENLARSAESVFSPDGKHLYVAALNGSVITLAAEGGKLSLVESQKVAGVTDGARGITISPDGNFVAVCAQYAHCVSVFSRERKSGKLTLLGSAKEGEKEVSGIEGVFRAAFSADGKFLYTSSGRFGGSNAVCVFAVDEDVKIEQRGKLAIGAASGLEWQGGNAVAVSPVKGDNRIVAGASLSDGIAELRRNPETGVIAFVGSASAGKQDSPGVAGLCFSPDGKFIYAADEAEGALYVFSCDGKSGK
jgi:6-phosphogluconolactonase (cycloisomerase 2 family)